MKDTTERPTQRQPQPLWVRLLWLVGIWAASVATLALVAYGLRLVMNAAGLSAPG